MKICPMHAPEVLNEAYDYAEPVPFSRGTRVDLPGISLLMISGTASVGKGGETLHAGNFQAQAWQMLENVTALLQSEGAKWNSVIKTTYFLRNMHDYPAFAKIRMDFFKKVGLAEFPASTCIQAGLCRPELLCEMEAMAVLERGCLVK